MFPLFATGINNISVTSGKIAAGVVDTGDAPLPISPRIFKKILIHPNVIFRRLGADDS